MNPSDEVLATAQYLTTSTLLKLRSDLGLSAQFWFPTTACHHTAKMENEYMKLGAVLTPFQLQIRVVK